MQVRHAEQSASMSTEGNQVRERRGRLGMTLDELARESGVSPDTLGDFEAGKRQPRSSTIAKVFAALDRIEEEVGLNAPPRAEAEPREFKFEVIDAEGFRIVAQGPVEDADELKRQVVDIIREIRRTEQGGDTPKSGS